MKSREECGFSILSHDAAKAPMISAHQALPAGTCSAVGLGTAVFSNLTMSEPLQY